MYGYSAKSASVMDMRRVAAVKRESSDTWSISSGQTGQEGVVAGRRGRWGSCFLCRTEVYCGHVSG